MNVEVIGNLFLRIKNHFDKKTDSTYFSVSQDSIAQIKNTLKNIDYVFLSEKTEKSIILFFIWVVFEEQSNSMKKNTRKWFISEDFKKFVAGLKYYSETIENDFIKIYNTKNFEKLKEMFYKKQISPITFYIIVTNCYQEKIQELENSNIFSILWYKTKMLQEFIKLDENIISNFVFNYKN